MTDDRQNSTAIGYRSFKTEVFRVFNQAALRGESCQACDCESLAVRPKVRFRISSDTRFSFWILYCSVDFLQISHTFKVHHEAMHNEEIFEIIRILLGKITISWKSVLKWPFSAHLHAYKSNRKWTFQICCFPIVRIKLYLSLHTKIMSIH